MRISTLQCLKQFGLTSQWWRFLRSGVVLEMFVSIESEESIGNSLNDIEISTIKMPFQTMT